jgi:hypothetical protein
VAAIPVKNFLFLYGFTCFLKIPGTTAGIYWIRQLGAAGR